MFKEILVPTDFSETALHALRLAVSLAKGSGGRITLLHVGVAPTAMVIDPLATVPPVLVEAGEAALREVEVGLEKLARAEVPADVPWRIVLREGLAADEIVHQAGRDGTDLLVMGTHGRTGISRFLIGSVAEAVLRHAPVPVLVTR